MSCPYSPAVAASRSASESTSARAATPSSIDFGGVLNVLAPDVSDELRISVTVRRVFPISQATSEKSESRVWSTNMDMKQWIESIAPSVYAAALKIEMTPSTMDSQLKSASGLKPETVVKIARAYGESPLLGLVELGLITTDEIMDEAGLKKVHVIDALADAKDADILWEIQKRLDERRMALQGDRAAQQTVAKQLKAVARKPRKKL